MSGNPPEFKWPSGAVFRTGHLKDENAYTKYQGHEYQRMLIEELDQIPSEKNYLRLRSSCRSTVKDLRPQVFLTTNPGGKGHQWIKKRFIDVCEWGKPFVTTEEINGKEVALSRIFIHATMDDNPILMENDPAYVMSIEELKTTDPELYKAWRFGDWDVFAGQVFREFNRDIHVIKPMIPRRSFNHVLWIDWGYSEDSAFAAYLSAIIELVTKSGDKYNQIVTYKEFYGNLKQPKEWARIIYNFCKANSIKLQYAVSDPAMHSPLQSGNTSIAKMMEEEWFAINGGHWLSIAPGSNNGRNSRINRVGMMHEWLSVNPASKLPYWMITENCINFIRTVPMLVYDENLVEAYDTGQEDHSADSASYGLEKVKFISVKPGALLGDIKQSLRIPYNKEGQQVAFSKEDLFDDYTEEKAWNEM